MYNKKVYQSPNTQTHALQIKQIKILTYNYQYNNYLVHYRLLVKANIEH